MAALACAFYTPKKGATWGQQGATCLNLWRNLRNFFQQFYKVLGSFWPNFSSTETF